MMGFVKKIVMGFVCIFLIFGVVSCTKLILIQAENFSSAGNAAIEFIEEKYPQDKFRVVNIKRIKKRYYVDLKVDDEKYSSVKIKCCVYLESNESKTHTVKIWSSTNINLLQEGKQ